VGQAADQLSATEVSPYGAAAGGGTSAGSPSAEELRAQIERQRSELGRDLEAFGDKVSPGRMVERKRAAVRESARGFKDRIMGVADSATSKVGGAAGSAGSSVTGAAGSVGSTVSGAAGSVVGAVGSVGESIGHAPAATMQAAQGNPLAVGLVAFGAGAVLAALLPTSEKERRVITEQAQPALQKAAEEVGTVAQQAVEDLKPAAQEAAEAVKSTAQEAADSVKQQAQGAAEEAKGAAQGATEQVKSSAQG